jgi:hypothetical protein
MLRSRPEFLTLEESIANTYHLTTKIDFSDLFRSLTADFLRSFLAVKLAGGAYSEDMEQVKPSSPIIPHTMKKYSFVMLAAIACLSALPSYAQDAPSSTELSVATPIESPELKQSEAKTDKQQPAPEPDKCASVDR